MKVVKEILQGLQEENSDQDEEINVSRLERYQEGGMRPLKVKFRFQVKPCKILSRAWKLAQRE